MRRNSFQRLLQMTQNFGSGLYALTERSLGTLTQVHDVHEGKGELVEPFQLDIESDEPKKHDSTRDDMSNISGKGFDENSSISSPDPIDDVEPDQDPLPYGSHMFTRSGSLVVLRSGSDSADIPAVLTCPMDLETAFGKQNSSGNDKTQLSTKSNRNTKSSIYYGDFNALLKIMEAKLDVYFSVDSPNRGEWQTDLDKLLSNKTKNVFLGSENADVGHCACSPPAVLSATGTLSGIGSNFQITENKSSCSDEDVREDGDIGDGPDWTVQTAVEKFRYDEPCLRPRDIDPGEARLNLRDGAFGCSQFDLTIFKQVKNVYRWQSDCSEFQEKQTGIVKARERTEKADKTEKEVDVLEELVDRDAVKRFENFGVPLLVEAVLAEDLATFVCPSANGGLFSRENRADLARVLKWRL